MVNEAPSGGGSWRRVSLHPAPRSRSPPLAPPPFPTSPDHHIRLLALVLNEYVNA